MAKTSPTQLSLKELRKNGYTVAIVEHWNPFAHIRQDLFGFIDLLAIKEGEILAIQSCAAVDHQKRKRKVLAHKNFPTWVKSGGKIEVWSVRKAGKKGKMKLWTIRKEPLTNLLTSI